MTSRKVSGREVSSTPAGKGATMAVSTTINCGIAPYVMLTRTELLGDGTISIMQPSSIYYTELVGR